jgi:beta-aspartyl-peptidase (threonine type)
MGLGSDLEPVAINLLGGDTHLADSMQFCLEYALRIQSNVSGVYYINTSFRGEDPDEMHLNQFYHTECEFLGGFDKGIDVAEKYVVTLAEVFLRDHADVISAMTGTTKHLEDLLEYYSRHDRRFPRIPLSQALRLPEIDESCWTYVLDSDPSKGRALTRRGELKLIEYSGGPVWLTGMDHLSVPFYQAYTDETRSKARCADLLLGNGEVLGLGERHLSSDLVRAALRQHQVLKESYVWYMEMRDIQRIQTTDWGMGLERFLAWAFQWTDIRDLAIVPRIKGTGFAP